MSSIFFEPSPGLLKYRGLLDRSLWIILAALALTPFVIDTRAYDDSFFTPKYAWLGIFSTLGVALVLARAAAGRAAQFPIHPLLFAFGGWIGWHWVSLIWAESSPLALDRACRVTIFAAAIWIAFQALKTRRAFHALGLWFIIVGDIVALWVLHDDIAQHFFPGSLNVVSKLSDWRGYLSGPFGNTSHLGDFLALSLIPTLILLGEARTAALRIFAALSVIIIPAGLIPCWSVGSKMGLIAGSLIMILVVWRTRRLNWFMSAPRLWIALAGCWALVIAFFLVPHPLNPHPGGIWHEAFASGRWHEGGPTRLAIWAQSLEMIRQNPIIGVGSGNFTYIFPRMDSALIWDNDPLLAYQGMWTNAAHNEIIQAWAELGCLGALFLVLIFVFAFWSLGRNLKQADTSEAMARIGLIGLWTAFLFQSQMNFTLQHPPGLWTFSMLILATLLEIRTRIPNTMPPLRAEFGIVALRVDWIEMNRPHTAGFALNLPLPAALPFGIILFVLAAATIPTQLRPVQAQAAFKQAMQLRVIAPEKADDWFVETLDRWPGLAEARNQYARFLLAQNRPTDALEQIELAGSRLDIWEFLLMRAQAFDQLGQSDAAAEAYSQLNNRVWRFRNQSTSN